MQSRAQLRSETGDQQEDDAVYQENHAYANYGAAQHESPWDDPHRQHPVEQQQMQSRISGTGTYSLSSGQNTSMNQPRSSPIAIVRPLSEQTAEPTGFETDDDDDSVVDVVERDAIRLRKKYGDKVLVASYQPGMIDETVKVSKSMLQAPYLGSLSKSESFLTSLPPISLSDEDRYKYEEEAPAEIASYGSLRESHQRGKFLDGPSSYREPRSGQIRRLDHRLRYPANKGLSSSQQQALSIGERIQQAQKQKETQKQNVNGSGESEAVATTSTLSMMMDEVTKSTESQQEEGHSEFERMVPIRGSVHVTSTFGAEDAQMYDKFDPPTMMSTSLTAFEILHTTSKSMTEYQTVQRFVEMKQERNDSALGNSGVPSGAKIREQQFHPLSRSLSDPSPRSLHHSPMATPTLQQLNLPLGGNNLLGVPGNPYWTHPYGIVDPSAQLVALANSAPNLDPIHNPDTDAAFDMDME